MHINKTHITKKMQFFLPTSDYN